MEQPGMAIVPGERPLALGIIGISNKTLRH